MKFKVLFYFSKFFFIDATLALFKSEASFVFSPKIVDLNENACVDLQNFVNRIRVLPSDLQFCVYDV